MAKTLAECNLLGWCPPLKANYLVEWIREHRPSAICEIGVFGGLSLLPMAVEAMTYYPATKVVGIDPWTVDACLEGMTEEDNREWWSKNSELGRVETSCRQAIHDMSLENVELWKGTSDMYKDSFQDNEIGLLSIDGNHGAQALIDGQNYLRKVKIGGLIAVDDEWWEEGDVKTVQVLINWLIASGCRHVESVGGCAMIIKEQPTRPPDEPASNRSSCAPGSA